MSATIAEERRGYPTYRLVSVILWLLPLCLFAIAAAYETVEHLVFEEILPSNVMYLSELVFFGIMGPVSVALALMYVRSLLKSQVEAQRKVEQTNRVLESNVAERTRHLEEARLHLQQNNVALSQANTELRQLDQMKSDFVALVSHSFRAPLTILNGALELIAQDSASLPESVKGTFSILAEEGVRLQNLVHTILDVSRLEGGKLKLNLGPVALEPLLFRVVDAAQPPQQAERRFTLDVPRGMPPAWADETYVEEVVRNLVSNAGRYSPESSPVHVAAYHTDGMLTVSVTDRGPGVPLDDKAKIFEPFQRSEVGERRDTSGLGLGLYFASKLVQAQGGRIWVESPVWPDADGPGARFTFTLPVDAEVPDMEETRP